MRNFCFEGKLWQIELSAARIRERLKRWTLLWGILGKKCMGRGSVSQIQGPTFFEYAKRGQNNLLYPLHGFIAQFIAAPL